MIKEIIRLSKQYRMAANIDSLATIIQEEYLMKNGFGSYNDISKDRLDELNQYISNRKKEISEKISLRVENKQYMNWIYSILTKKNQGLEDVDKLILETEKLDFIKKRVDIVNKKLLKAGKKAIGGKDFDIQRFKTYGDLHIFNSEYFSYLKESIERDKIKSEKITFPLFVQNGKYKIYSIGRDEEEDFKRIYGKSGWDTGWCIAQGTVDFHVYLGNYDSYYLILDNMNNPVALISLEDLQFKDIHDDKFKNMNKEMVDIIDEFFEKNGFDITEKPEEQDDEKEFFGDFLNYFLIKDFENDNNYNYLFEDLNKYKKRYSKDDFIVYSNDESNFYYIVRNHELLMIVNDYLDEILYYEKITQDLLNCIFDCFKNKEKYLSKFVSTYSNLFSNFSLVQYYDLFAEKGLADEMYWIIKYNKKIDCKRKELFVDYLIKNKKEYRHLIEKLHKDGIDKDIKEYIKKNIVTETGLKEIEDLLIKDHSPETIKSCFDLIITKDYSAEERNILHMFSLYVKYVDSEYKKKIVDFIVENGFMENGFSVLLKETQDDKFIELLIKKTLDSRGHYSKYFLIEFFDKMDNQQQEKLLHILLDSGDSGDINYAIPKILKKTEDKKIKTKLLGYLLNTDGYIKICNAIRSKDIEDPFFIFEFIKLAFDSDYGNVIFDYIKNIKMDFDGLIDYLLSTDKQNDFFFEDIIIKSDLLSENSMNKIIDYFIKTEKINILKRIIYSSKFKKHKNLKIKIIDYLFDLYDKNDIIILLKNFKNDREFVEEALNNFKDKNKKEVIRDLVDVFWE